MRTIVHGIGAIGGVTAAAMSLAGEEVVGIARGGMLQAIRKGGLTLHSPRSTERAQFECVAHPSEISFRADDVVLLCVKGQDTATALNDLRAAGLRDQAIFCCQNGVANERAALRMFPNVHAVTVMMPATYLTPGEVDVHVEPRFGVFEFGRFAGGTDSVDEVLGAVLERANIEAFLSPTPMEAKYGKLMLNLGNIVGALLPEGEDASAITAHLKAEAEEVLAAAGIAWRTVGSDDKRRETFLRNVEVNGRPRPGNSTRQSLARGAMSGVETDYINGEIALLARLHGAEAPLNAQIQHIAARAERPGELTVAKLCAALGLQA